MGEFAIGQSVLRREDPRLLRGQGRFFDDLNLADQLHAAIVRSPHAHADITDIDTRTAQQMPGVHAVLTGEDYRADGLGSLPSMAPYKRRGGGSMFLPPRPAIALNRVMHVGYPVAVSVWLWDSRSTRFSERSREGTPEVRACPSSWEIALNGALIARLTPPAGGFGFHDRESYQAIFCAVATSREDHHLPRPGRATRHRQWG